jgi:hypothetical protein
MMAGCNVLCGPTASVLCSALGRRAASWHLPSPPRMSSAAEPGAEPLPPNTGSSSSSSSNNLAALDDEVLLLCLTAGAGPGCRSLGSLELARLECTAKAFRRQVVEEAARVLVGARLPRERHRRWLHCLHELETCYGPGHPLRFSAAAEDVDIVDDGATARRGDWPVAPGSLGRAVCSQMVMRRGVHHANFTICGIGSSDSAMDTALSVGIVREGHEPGPDYDWQE